MTTYTLSTKINSTLVELAVYEESLTSAGLNFFINGDMVYEENSNKVAISRWLLKEFRGLQNKYKKLSISVYEDDDYGEYRYQVYKKLGFTPIEGGYGDEMIWVK